MALMAAEAPEPTAVATCIFPPVTSPRGEDTGHAGLLVEPVHLYITPFSHFKPHPSASSVLGSIPISTKTPSTFKDLGVSPTVNSMPGNNFISHYLNDLCAVGGS